MVPIPLIVVLLLYPHLPWAVKRIFTIFTVQKTLLESGLAECKTLLELGIAECKTLLELGLAEFKTLLELGLAEWNQG